MYSHYCKEDSKHLATSNYPVNSNKSKLKPSPTSGEDVTKGENTQNTQNISEHTGFNTSRFPRKKSGLKPIRPRGCLSLSSNVVPTTPGKFPHTPRLNLKENDHFPSTPKFSRSESTPELHRTRKMDCMHPMENGYTPFKTRDVLQDSSMSNLMSATSDSLPDIFRQPITQQPVPKVNATEEKVSKWGYGPSSLSECPAGFIKPHPTECTKDLTNKNVTETGANCHSFETPKMLSKVRNQIETGTSCQKASNFGSQVETGVHCPPFETPKIVSKFGKQTESGVFETPQIMSKFGNPMGTGVKCPTFDTPKIISKFGSSSTNPSGVKIRYPLTSKFEKSATLDSLATEKPSNLSTTSTTASNLYNTTQPTVKCLATEEFLPRTPISNPKMTMNPTSTSKTIQLKSQPIAVAPSVSLSAKEEAPAADVVVPSPPFLQPVEPLKAKVTGEMPLQLGTNKPASKQKQISVNGKMHTVMRLLGRGGSSVVYQVLNSTMTDIFALKVVRLESVDEVTAEGYINEVRLLKRLQGLSRVVRLLDFEYNEEEEKLLLIMEKGDTDFASVIRSRTSINAVNLTLVRFYWQEMLEAVGQIHDKNVIHSDLKPANFLLVNGGLKLIDFGIATSIQGDMTSIMKDSQCGTYNYMAPEAIKSSSPVGANQEYKISRKTDVWSLGCILYNLTYKNPPFHKIKNTIEKLNAIVDDRYVIDFPPTDDPLVVSVLKGCLDRDPRKRPSIDQLLAHPYLTYNSLPDSSALNDCSQLHSRLQPFMVDGKLTDEAKELIRQWL